MMTSHQAYAFADGAYDDAELVLEVGLMQKAEEVEAGGLCLVQLML